MSQHVPEDEMYICDFLFRGEEKAAAWAMERAREFLPLWQADPSTVELIEQTVHDVVDAVVERAEHLPDQADVKRIRLRLYRSIIPASQLQHSSHLLWRTPPLCRHAPPLPVPQEYSRFSAPKPGCTTTQSQTPELHAVVFASVDWNHGLSHWLHGEWQAIPLTNQPAEKVTSPRYA